VTCNRFERRKRDGVTSFHFMGFVSFYSFFCWPDTKRLRLACVCTLSLLLDTLERS